VRKWGLTSLEAFPIFFCIIFSECFTEYARRI
jgi:hypothetical protein